MWLLSKVQTSALHFPSKGMWSFFSFPWSLPRMGVLYLLCLASSQRLLRKNTTEPQAFCFEWTPRVLQLLNFYFILFSLKDGGTLCLKRTNVLLRLPLCPSESLWVSHSFLRSTFSSFAACPSWRQKLPEAHENEKRSVKYTVNPNFQTPISLNYDFIQSGSHNYFSQVLML